jgi:hypothetical protein
MAGAIVNDVLGQIVQGLVRRGDAGGLQRIAQVFGQRIHTSGVDIVFAVGRLSESGGQAINDGLAGCALLDVSADNIVGLTVLFLHFHLRQFS